MKTHAANMEQAAKTNMDETNQKVEQILETLNKDIADSSSVDQVNSLTYDIMSIAYHKPFVNSKIRKRETLASLRIELRYNLFLPI